MRDVTFTSGEFYHVYNRGVDKRVLFQDVADQSRFIKSVMAFNNVERRNKQALSKLEINVSDYPLVKIHAYCLMPNHYHLLLQQVEDGGLSFFLNRLGNGYTKYFNKRRVRSGSLFEQPFQAKHVQTDDYLLHLTRYIHLNPLSIVRPGWKEGGEGSESDWVFLESYPWSSYCTYLEKDSVPFVDTKIRDQEFSGPDDYRQFVQSWARGDLPIISPLLFEE